MKRFLIMVTAFVVTTGLTACSGTGFRSAIEHPAPAVTVPAVTLSVVTSLSAIRANVMPATVIRSAHVSKTASLRVGRLTRSWVAFSPARSWPRSAPIIVVLSGIGATLGAERGRDHLLPYVDAGKAELVYPVPIQRSWDAGGCCGAASRLKINDVAFLEKLVPRIDPGHKRLVYFAGYSNGGRMVYALECHDAGLFDGIAAVKADPMPGCVVTRPQNVLVISALDDPAVPYKPGGKGRETPPATIQIARLHRALRCTSRSVSAQHGDMSLRTWSSCQDGRRLGWAVYAAGGHSFPPPTRNYPSAAQIIWSFFTKTALAPLPT